MANGPDQDSKQAAKQAFDDQTQKDQSGSMPQVDWSTFIISLSSSILTHLGEVPDPETGQTGINLELARHSINILELLEDKTTGNLTAEEERQLKDILFELRIKYVQKSK
jgi:hypothetical protein